MAGALTLIRGQHRAPKGSQGLYLIPAARFHGNHISLFVGGDCIPRVTRCEHKRFHAQPRVFLRPQIPFPHLPRSAWAETSRALGNQV